MNMQSRNENVYSEPLKFKPERFLADKAEKDPITISFGWGRRICPGRFLAENRLVFLFYTDANTG
jgi:cytochrome P450